MDLGRQTLSETCNDLKTTWCYSINVTDRVWAEEGFYEC